MPRALITGHLGFIGGHIYRTLREMGWDLKGMDKKISGPSHNCLNLGAGSFADIDVVFHCAANASIPDSLKMPISTHDNNIISTIRVLEFARAHKCPVIYSSSSSIYGDVQTPYSLQKSIGEQYLKLYWELYRVPSVSLRYFNVYGEGQPDNGAYKLALGIFLRQYKQGKPFTIVGTGNQRRDFIHVDDVVRANLAAYQQVDACDVFDVGVSHNHSINELCDMIDPNHPKVTLPLRVEPFANLAERDLGFEWKPKVDLKSWIQSQV